LAERWQVLYMGTTVGDTWWKRYHGGMFARGNGVLWLETDAIRFLRRLTRKPVSIPLDSVCGTELARWHAGMWGIGNPVVKVRWESGGRPLTSGFLVSKKSGDAAAIREAIELAAKSVKGG